nr:hypothetical protein CPGR_05658 [Mycolicibacter nonchromogenicus]
MVEAVIEIGNRMADLLALVITVATAHGGTPSTSSGFISMSVVTERPPCSMVCLNVWHFSTNRLRFGWSGVSANRTRIVCRPPGSNLASVAVAVCVAEVGLE